MTAISAALPRIDMRPETDKVVKGAIGGGALGGIGIGVAAGAVGMALGAMNGPWLKYPGGVGALGGALVFGGAGLLFGAAAGGAGGAALGGIVELLDKD